MGRPFRTMSVIGRHAEFPRPADRPVGHQGAGHAREHRRTVNAGDRQRGMKEETEPAHRRAGEKRS